MIRRAMNVHIYHYRQNKNCNYEYAILQRADDPKIWQGVSGGVRDNETIGEAALRVSSYEAGTSLNMPLHKLTCMSYIPSYIFGNHAEEWGKDVVVVPMYYFAMPLQDDIKISEQHICYK